VRGLRDLLPWNEKEEEKSKGRGADSQSGNRKEKPKIVKGGSPTPEGRASMRTRGLRDDNKEFH